MKSIQAFTNEVDDLDKAINELKSQIDESKLLKNSCAIVFTGYETDVHELARRLNETFSFPFIGCTGLAILSSGGYSHASISMTVMTADDCSFAIGITDNIYEAEDLKFIRKTYYEVSQRLDEKEKIIFAYSSWWQKIISDDIVKIFDEVSGGVPVFGGVASDYWSFDKMYVFCNDEVSNTKAVMLLISGNIKPIFSIEHSTTSVTDSHKLVTKSKGNIVYELNNEPALKYIEAIGGVTNNEYVIHDYLATPFISTIKTDDGDTIDVIRCLVRINKKEKYCTFIGAVEENSELNVVLIGREDIIGSVQKSFDYIFDEMKKNEDYQYSAVFCSSCSARYALIVADKNAEGRTYADRLPEGVNVQGFYSYGEYCPSKGKKYGKLYNGLSNETFAVMAI